MTQQPETESNGPRQEFEICAVCGKDLWSISTRNVGDHFMDYTCALPIQSLVAAVNRHIVAGIIDMTKNHGLTLREACIRAGVRHLDVKQLAELERIL